MPVELKKIPEKMPIPEPPSVFRWIVIVALITVLGAILALFLWPKEMLTDSAWFWFCILVIPFSVGLISYAFRLRVYENERDRLNYWNQLHQEQHDIKVKKGQRPAGLLGKAFVTPVASNKLASALINYGSQLQSFYFAGLQQTLTTARLEPFHLNFSKETYRKRLTCYLTRVLHMLEPDLSALPTDKLSVRVRHDGVLDNAQIRCIWQDIFPSSYVIDEFVTETEGDGMMWLDTWLDQNAAALMLSVEINLFVVPRNYQSESVSALLLGSPAWLAQNDIKPEVVIHRPVIATEDSQTLEDMLCWGRLIADEVHTLWQWQVNKEALTRLIQQSEKLGYLPGRNESYMAGDLFGHPGVAAGNIALICASEHAVASDKPQWVMMTDQTTHQAIVRQSEH